MHFITGLKLLIVIFGITLILFFTLFFLFLNLNFLEIILFYLLAGGIILILELYLRIQYNLNTEMNKLTSRLQKAENLQREGIMKEEKNINNMKKQIEYVTSLEESQKISGKELLKYVTSLEESQKISGKELTKINNNLEKHKEDSIRKILINFNLLKRMFWNQVERNRKEKLLSLVPNIFNYKSVLYIGAREDRFDFGREFKEAGYEVSVLEIYKPNVEVLKKIKWLKEVIHNDVKKFETKKKYDVVFWWHGPEHINEKDLVPVLEKLRKLTKKVIVLGCPWGKVNPDREYENPYEKHISHYEKGFFEKLGYKTAYLEDKDLFGSGIIAVKFKIKENGRKK